MVITYIHSSTYILFKKYKGLHLIDKCPYAINENIIEIADERFLKIYE